MRPTLFVLSACAICASALPNLPPRFTAIVEANFVLRNQTQIMEEWYDATKNKAKRSFYYNHTIRTSYEDFSDGKDQLWNYATTHSDTSNAISCTLVPYSTNRLPYQNDETQSGNLVSSAEWFEFGGNLTETYLGNGFEIRGINTEAWSRNGTSSFVYAPMGPYTINTTFTMTYYFAAENWDYFHSSMHGIPVRVELVGERITDNGTYVDRRPFRHIYDYVRFFADDLILDEELSFHIPDFYEQCNLTEYCTMYDSAKICSLTKGPELPNITDSFTAIWEWSESDALLSAKTTSLMQVFYDYDSDRMHSVFYDSDKNAMHQLDILEDGEEGQRWSWTGDDVNNVRDCIMAGFSSNYTDWDYTIPVSNGHIINPNRFLQFDDNRYDPQISDEIWMGYTTIRGISAEKWKSNYNVVINGGEHNLWLFWPLPSNQRVIMNGSIYWYFSYNWTFSYAPTESIVPIATEYDGIYKLYNWSDTSNEYILVQRMDIGWVANIVQWVSGAPDESYLSKPTYWKRDCAIDAQYCMKEDHADHADQDVCDTDSGLPILPKHKYFMTLEGNDITNETSHVIKVWFDYDNNEFRTEYYHGDDVVVTFDDFDEERRWTWTHKINDMDSIVECKVESYEYANQGQQFEEDIDIGHVKSAADLWRFGEKYNVSYLGNDFKIRGINARAWHSAVNETFSVSNTSTYDIAYESTFYFADSDWNYYRAIEASDIPLAVLYKGTYKSGNISGEFETVYHVSSFFSGQNAFDKSEMEFVFAGWYSECDVSEYCKLYPTNGLCSEARGPQMPRVPNQWYAMLEGTIDDTSSYAGTWLLEEWYDYDNNEAHVVWHTGPNWKGDAIHQLDRLDLDQKWTWFGDGDDDGDEISQCVLTPGIPNFTGLDSFVQETNGHVSKASVWFRWNDTEHASLPVWNGYTTFRGIPAEKWQSKWSEYDEMPASPMQDTYAIQFDADVTYYWSNTSWNIVVSGSNDSVPLGLEMDGAYTLYNYSESSEKYDILWMSNSFKSQYHFSVFDTLEQSEEYFEIPKQWKKCNISLYCDKYPNNEPCTGYSSDSETKEDVDSGLETGYIVLIVLLTFFVGLIIGVSIDRYLVRKKGKATFKHTEDAGL